MFYTKGAFNAIFGVFLFWTDILLGLAVMFRETCSFSTLLLIATLIHMKSDKFIIDG